MPPFAAEPGDRTAPDMDPATLAAWTKFAACGLLIAIAGREVCLNAERISRATGLSGGWIGLALVAVVTSLPELASGITAVTVASAPNIAVGNALGACVVNLMMVAVLDLMHRSGPLYRRIGAAHLLSASFGVLLLGLAAFGLLLGASDVRGAPTALLYLGWYTPAVFALYLVALRAVYLHDRSLATPQEPSATHDGELGRAVRRFAAASIVVVAAGIWLPFLATELAQALGWNRSFVGTLFVALVTTLPEMAVTISALRIGAIDLAVGNLLGSNLFNVAIIAIDDVFYKPGPLLSDVSVVHTVTALSAMIMTALAMIGLVLRPTGRVLRTVSWVSLGVLLVFVLNGLLVFLHGD
jgi:cation:H+ antiporter